MRIVLTGWLIISSLALAGCGSNENGSDEAMSGSEQPEKKYAEASERPGAIVIRPRLNPDMGFDKETGRTTDFETGEYFVSKHEFRSGGIYKAAIRAKDGSVIHAFELKSGRAKINDGAGRRLIWEVFWARRGGILKDISLWKLV